MVVYFASIFPLVYQSGSFLAIILKCEINNVHFPLVILQQNGETCFNKLYIFKYRENKNINKINRILKETDLDENEDIIHTRFQIIIKTGPPKYKSELIMYPSRPINYPLGHSIST